MINYEIKSLNYVSIGKKLGLINLDLKAIPPPSPPSSAKHISKSPNRIMMMEDYFSHEKNLRKKESKKNLLMASSNELPKHSKEAFVLDLRGMDILSRIPTPNQLKDKNSDEILYPIYNLKKISVKSKFKKVLAGPPFRGIGKHRDIYLPDLKETPLKICQAPRIGTCFLTAQMKDSPFYLRARFLKDKNQLASAEFYTMEFLKNKLKTYLYGILQYEIFRNGLEEGLSFGEAIVQAGLKAENIFYPMENLDDLSFNYIVMIDQIENGLDFEINNPKEKDFQLDGDIYADIMVGKNTYNSTYSMEMKDCHSISHYRNYLGIIECGGNIFLKYLDKDSFKEAEGENLKILDRDLKSGEKDPVNLKLEKSEDDESNEEPTYQKVELLIPNSFINRNIWKHKSTLFSLEIFKTGLEKNADVSNNGNLDSFKDKIRSDLERSIRKIAYSVCPVNTQLFKVYFKV